MARCAAQKAMKKVGQVANLSYFIFVRVAHGASRRPEIDENSNGKRQCSVRRLGARSWFNGAGKPARESGPDIVSSPKLLPSAVVEERA